MHQRVACDITAVILAGGRSRRFGQEKALDPTGGEPMIRQAIRCSGDAVDGSEVVVSSLRCTTDLPSDPPHRIAAEALPGSRR